MDGCQVDRARIWSAPNSFFPPRLKQLSVEPYSQEEAERAAGMGSYVPPQRLAVPTEVSTEVPEMDTST